MLQKLLIKLFNSNAWKHTTVSRFGGIQASRFVSLILDTRFVFFDPSAVGRFNNTENIDTQRMRMWGKRTSAADKSYWWSNKDVLEQFWLSFDCLCNIWLHIWKISAFTAHFSEFFPKANIHANIYSEKEGKRELKFQLHPRKANAFTFGHSEYDSLEL
jgi:hypothetical protein